MENKLSSAVAIVDFAGSHHGLLMESCARFQAFAPTIRWITPDLQLPVTLASLDDVAAVAIPIAVKGATMRDRFTQSLVAAIQGLTARGIPVFVAAGNYRPNLLAEAGIAVANRHLTGSAGTSQSCVRAAVEWAYQSSIDAFRRTNLCGFASA
jgi:hypothetical protein